MPFSFYHLAFLPYSLFGEILNGWLHIFEVAKLDTACCSTATRPLLLEMLSSRLYMRRQSIVVSRDTQFAWFVKRAIGACSINIDTKIHISEAFFNYFIQWGKDMRTVQFNSEAGGDLYLISLRCRSLVSVSFCGTNTGHLFLDILYNNPTLEEVKFASMPIEPYMLRDVTLPRLRTLCYTGERLVNKGFCECMSHLSDSVTRLRLTDVQLTKVKRLLYFATRFKDLHTLDLSHTNVNSRVISNITILGPSIVHLQLNGCDSICDSGVLSIAQNLTCLRTLDIRDCMSLSDDSIGHLAEHCAPRLVEVYFGIDTADLATVAVFLRRCTILHTLGLEVYEDFNVDVGINNVFKALSNVKRLHLRGSALISDTILTLIGQHCQNITHLALLTVEDTPAVEYFTAKGLFALQDGCPDLRQLVVYRRCPLLQNELAVLLWKALRPAFSITTTDTIDYDAMKCDV